MISFVVAACPGLAYSCSNRIRSVRHRGPPSNASVRRATRILSAAVQKIDLLGV
jgi:hypothetical protein